MKKFFGFMLIVSSFQAFAQDSSLGECTNKVKEVYAERYDKIYGLASNTFMSNFFARKAHLFHMLAFPEIAFRGLSNNENMVAENVVKKLEKIGIYREQLPSFYEAFLKDEKECEKIEANINSPRAIKRQFQEYVEKLVYNTTGA